LELLDARVHVLLEQVLHPLTKHHLSLLSLVRQSSQAHHLAIVDVEGSSEYLEPVVGMRPPD